MPRTNLQALLAAGDLAGHANALAALGVIDEAAAKVIGQLDRAELDDLIALRDVVVQVRGQVDATDPSADDISMLTAAGAVVKAIRSELDRRLATTESRRVAADRLAASIAADEDGAVAAAGKLGAPSRPKLPSISYLAARAPIRSRPTRTVSAGRMRALTASGTELDGNDPEQVAAVFTRELESASRARASWKGKAREHRSVVRFEFDFPEDRQLGPDETVNMRRIEDVASPQALAASGGVCGPVAAVYEQPVISDASRPVRDALAQFGASRGGIRLPPVHSFASVTADGPASVWTEATDLNPGASTKPHATLTCAAPNEYYVNAVPAVVKLGQLQRRFFPEQVAAYLETARAVQARLAEATLLASMVTASTAVTASNYEIGACRDFLAECDRLAAAYRYRNRMALTAPLRLIIPGWTYDMFRADLARNVPGDSGSGTERLATADAEIDHFFAVRNINVTRMMDSPTGAAVLQGFGPLGPGQATPWPTVTEVLLYAEGNWLFLDGGLLDLGIIVDSTLAASNDAELFFETFELAVPRGFDSLVVSLKIDPSGASVGTVSPYAGGTETLGS